MKGQERSQSAFVRVRVSYYLVGAGLALLGQERVIHLSI